MKVEKTHPNHIEFEPFESRSNYNKTIKRFEYILEKKLGVNPNTRKNDYGIKNPLDVNRVDLKVGDIITDVSNPSFDASEKINKYFKNTALKGLGSEFQKAQNKYGVNAYFLASVAAHESAKGSSAIAKEKNNLFGFKAFDNNPFESAETFDSFEDSIDKVAKYLSEEYLNENGKYYFGKSVQDINKNYATDKKWHESVSQIMKEIIE